MNKCKQCETELIGRNRNGTYCSNKCQSEYQYNKYITEWKEGKQTGNAGKALQFSKHVRRYMLEKTSCSCEQCGWNKKHPVDGRPLVEIDHIDGDALNSQESNLKVLCPNCHSMTPTFRARNKTSSRSR